MIQKDDLKSRRSLRSKSNLLESGPTRESRALRSNTWLGPVIVAAGFLCLLTGCATAEKYSLTYRLWSNDDLSKFSEPAPELNLALLEATNRIEVLVQYDALSDRHSTVIRRTYSLWPNQARIMAGKQPRWAKSPALSASMRSVPVLTPQAAATNPPPAGSAYAVAADDGRGFILYRPTEPMQTFDLPVYAETFGTVSRVALTPLAVAGDTLMVGGVVAVVGFLIWVQSGAPH